MSEPVGIKNISQELLKELDDIYFIIRDSSFLCGSSSLPEDTKKELQESLENRCQEIEKKVWKAVRNDR